MMRKRALALLCAASFAAPLAAQLSVGLMPACNSIPLVVAEVKGLFTARGVTVSLVPFMGQLERETALQTGALDGTVSDLINAIQSWSHGSGARVTSATEGGFGLLSSPGSSLQSLADWKALTGRKVRTGLLENSIVFYLSERMVTAFGADAKRIELVPIVQVPARLEMLLANKVEAACLPEPLSTLAASRGAHLLADSEGMGTTPGVLLFTRKALTEKLREIALFYKAYNDAVREVNAHPEEYRAAIVARCEFPSAVAAIMRIPRFRPAFLPPESLVRDVGAWMKEKSLVDRLPGYLDIVVPDLLGAHAVNQ
jgi:NitT/TauT family transport system substrate-binding protein